MISNTLQVFKLRIPFLSNRLSLNSAFSVHVVVHREGEFLLLKIVSNIQCSTFSFCIPCCTTLVYPKVTYIDVFNNERIKEVFFRASFICCMLS